MIWALLSRSTPRWSRCRLKSLNHRSTRGARSSPSPTSSSFLPFLPSRPSEPPTCFPARARKREPRVESLSPMIRSSLMRNPAKVKVRTPAAPPASPPTVTPNPTPNLYPQARESSAATPASTTSTETNPTPMTKTTAIKGIEN